jgi:Ca2+:H+ antiporter
VRRFINVLLLGLPIAVVARLAGWPHWVVFLAAALSLLPLAGWIGRSTEHLAATMGSAMGGLLNATFGNAAELIITILALRKGLVELVKASITGSIIGNTLLILGLSAFIGGRRHGRQKFNATAAGRHAAMMILAIGAMALPAVFATVEKDAWIREEVSIGVSILLLVTYFAYVYYSYFSKRDRDDQAPDDAHAPHGAVWSKGKAIGVLGAAVLGTVAASELLVHSVAEVSHAVGLSQFFVGLIVVPLIGNVAEHYSAVEFAARNRMELALSIAANSSTQIAVFVAPLLVLISLLFHPMDLIFQPIELVTLFASTAIFSYISLDGETNWLEGLQLLVLYLIAAVAFFFLPS